MSRKEYPHHKCNGTGIGSRVTSSCRGCGGTGEAADAFAKQMRKYNWHEVSGHTAEAYLPDLLNSYLVARYGSADSHIPLNWDVEEGEDPGPTPSQIYTVMEHSIDHKGLFTVCELAHANFGAVFVWLAKEDARVMADWKEDTV